jgi:hypothetical protein
MNMNSNLSIRSSTPATDPLTTWPEYKQREDVVTTYSLKCNWQTDASLNSAALNSYKVKKILKTAQTSIENAASTRPYYISVITMRRQYINMAANEMLQCYTSEAQLIVEQVLAITKQINKIAKKPSLLEGRRVDLSNTLESISKDLMIFRDKVNPEKKDLETSPLAKDPRSKKKNIQPFDKLGLQHQEYLAQVSKWQQSQVLANDASIIDCWKWKGKIKAIQRIESQVINLANSLHAVECCLTSLQNNAKNKEYYASPPVKEEARIIFIGDMSHSSPINMLTAAAALGEFSCDEPQPPQNFNEK